MSTTNQLLSQLTAAQTDLDLALADGEDTAPIRAQITGIEADIAAARTAEIEAEREQAQKAVDAAHAAGADLAVSEQAVIEAATAVPELAQLGEDVPAIEVDPVIAAAAHDVALAQAALLKVEGTYQRHQANAGKIRTRLAEEQSKVEAIKARRSNGDRRDDDAGAMTLLGDDIADLQRLLDSTQTKADAAAPVTRRQDLEAAQKRLAQVRGDAQLRTANTRLQIAEQAFLRAYAAQRAAERVAGLHLSRPSGTYRANIEFKTIVSRH